MSIDAIDFGRLYRDHMAAAGRRPKPPGEWDARAAELNRSVAGSPYVEAFIARMDLAGARSLLDVGCGTGAIALPLAPRLERVVGLDYSRGMLDCLLDNAARQGLQNVAALQLAWEDDWSEVPCCDLVVASRSTAVTDMADALAKLHAKARLRVYLTHLVGGRFIDRKLIEVIGRNLPPLPDYIYILNILYRMGIHARLDYIRTESRFAGITDCDDLARKLAFALGELDPDERRRLRAWYDADPEQARRGGAPMRWAFISWEKAEG